MRQIIQVALPLAFALTPPVQAQDILLRDLNVIDVASGTTSAGADILIRDGLIAQVGPDLTPDTEMEVVDGAGAYVIPGLWDAHVHVFSSEEEPETAFDMYLINGVTGIRDMGALLPFERQQQIVAEIESGDRRGPRVILSGAWVDASPGSWPGMFLADTPQEAGDVVQDIAAQGWAAVKSYSMLDRDTYMALADATHAAGLPLVGHIPESVVLRDAIDAGQDGMEHFGRVTMACSSQEEAMIDRVREALLADDPRSAMITEMQSHNQIVLDTWDAALCDQIVADMAAIGMAISPTLVVSDFYTGTRPSDDALRMRVLPAAVREGWLQPDFRLSAMTDELRAIADQSIALDWRTFKLAHDAGVPILASTDASYANPFIFHGFSLLDELDRYVETGLTPQEALFTATVAPPTFLDLPDQNGTIASGVRADLVLLAENPLEGLGTLRNPVAVVANGQLFDRVALDGMIAALLAPDN